MDSLPVIQTEIRDEILTRLVSGGLSPFDLSKALGIPVSQLQAIVHVESPKLTAPEDATIAEELRILELKAVRKASKLLDTAPPVMQMRIITPLLKTAASRVGTTGDDAGGEGEAREALEQLFKQMRSIETDAKAINE